MKRSMWLVPALVAGVLFIPAGAALASCAEPLPLQQSIDEAPAVFVGTVTALDFQERVATVEVHEVWKGDVASEVVVNGGSPLSHLRAAGEEGQDLWTSVDRTYVAGDRYLFVPWSVEDGAFMDSQCSNTQVYGPNLDAFRPADARVVEPPASGGSAGVWIGLGAAAVLTASAALWVLARRRAPAAA